MAGYQPGIHGPELKTLLPVVRLLVNAGAAHNGLSFFRDLKIERVQLQSRVRHFRRMKLQNSIGNLSADSAFQPWGPLPVVGSYLDIKNSVMSLKKPVYHRCGGPAGMDGPAKGPGRIWDLVCRIRCGDHRRCVPGRCQCACQWVSTATGRPTAESIPVVLP